MKASMMTCLALLSALTVGAVASPVPGLMDQPQTFPWSVGLAPVVQEEAGGLEPGTGRVKSSVLWFNTYRQFGIDDGLVQLVDMEGWLGTVSAAWSPAPGWELRSQAQGWALGGGLLDGFLSGFHGVLTLPNQGRNFTPSGAYRDYLDGWFDRSRPGSGLTQVTASTRWFEGPWSWTTWLKPPLPAPRNWGWVDRWSGGTSVGWGTQGALPWDLAFGLGASLGLVAVDSEPDFPHTWAGLVPQGGLYGVVFTPWGARGVVQGAWTQVPRRGEGYLAQGAGLLTSGIQVTLGPTWTLELALTEEFLTWSTMEVGFQAGLTWTP